MDMESAFASVVPVMSMMHMTTDRTGLACISGIYVLNLNACKSGFVFYIPCKSIE